MDNFNYYHPVEVRYSDLDPQGHLNNACYLTFFEQARIHYWVQTGLWDGRSFANIGIIVANAQVNFLAPVYYGQKLRVGARITRLGNKSMTWEYSLQDMESGQEMANGSTVVVAYDSHTESAVPIPDTWRSFLTKFEGLST